MKGAVLLLTPAEYQAGIRRGKWWGDGWSWSLLRNYSIPSFPCT